MRVVFNEGDTVIRVIICGAGGKMGQEVVKTINSAEDMQIVALIDPSFGLSDGLRFSDLDSAVRSVPADIMIDFTRPDTVEKNIETALANSINCVVGTTGLSTETLERLSASAPDTCLFMAPNFAIGAVLMMRFAKQAARIMETAEVIEFHHDRKLDAPSGTAIRTAQLIAHEFKLKTDDDEIFGASHADDPTETILYEGARGANVEGVSVHSVRLQGYVAHQEVIFGGQGQTLTIRHDSVDRSSFMPGVLLACRSIVVGRKGLIVGLEHFLGSVDDC